MEFVNLYIQTEYSILNSTIKLKKLVSKLCEEKISACAICDTNSMYGTIKFYSLCKENKIKPIIGLKLEIKAKYNYVNFVLLYAKNNAGYINLMRLSSVIKTNKQISLEQLKSYSQGVLAVLPAAENEACLLFSNGRIAEFKQEYTLYAEMFDDLYIGLDLQGASKHSLIKEFYSYKEQFNLNFTALHRANYMYDDEFEAFKLLRCVDLNCNEYNCCYNEEFWNYSSQSDLFKEFQKYPELISATNEIANKCSLEIEFGRYKLPRYSQDILDTKKYLQELCLYGLKKRLEITGKQGESKKYLQRLMYELNVINKMGFNDYFLIVYDFIKWSKKNNILVGPGRGSGPSSLVSYSLGITEVDPLEYNLLFERFLSEERVTMPDIDTDFPDTKRDKVIKYVYEKYGFKKVAHITTFGTYGPKGAIRDIARVKKIPDLFVNELIKRVDGKLSIAECENDEMFVRLIHENKNLEEVIQITKIIEGIPRNISTHAAGIVITGEDLVNYTPLQLGMNGIYQTQYEAGDLEKLGLLKMDFLGIRNLSIIEEVLNEISLSEHINIDINKIPLDDKLTFDLISKGETDGIFQFESNGMKNVLTKFKPNSILDLANVNALYRPGPMEMIPEFLEGKFKRKEVVYLHDDLKEILAPTYGVIVFQEQIMLIAQKFAGYTLGEADILRRAVSKKKREVLERERIKFVDKSVKLGYDKSLSNRIYDYIVKFADYGFNKSHAVVYSLLAYQMAYLKAHYYKYFMANMMGSSINSTNLMKRYIVNCKKNNIVILPPSINYSSDKFDAYKRKSKSGKEMDVIYYSLTGINNVGNVIVKDLLQERNDNGLFVSFEDFIHRTKKIINKRAFSYLVYSGSLDDFNLTRKSMIENYDSILMREDFGIPLDKLNEVTFSQEEYSYDEMARLEFEALGLNIKFNFFLKYASDKHKYHAVNICNMPIGRKCNVLCLVKRIKVIKTKKNEEMAFIEITDGDDIIEGVIFPKCYSLVKNILKIDSVYVLNGSLEERNDNKQIIVENAYIIR